MQEKIVIVGAGPAGCVAALHFAQQGEQVLLLEGNPDGAAKRLAGEWLHPYGVSVLNELGVAKPKGAQVGRGFVVYPHDGSEPVLMPYPDRGFAFAFEHHELVEALRERVRQESSIEFRTWARVQRLDAKGVVCRQRGSKVDEHIPAARVIGADGRASTVRREIGGEDERVKVSHVVGLELHDTWLPHEGYGHVFLGGPGPVLAYRIAPDIVRVLIDIPTEVDFERSADWLIDNYFAVFPLSMRQRVGEALRQDKIRFLPVQVQTRRFYGKGQVALVGDAVGYYHPLTAAGMTLGMADAEALIASEGLDDYTRRRVRETRVPEILASSLYEAFSDGGVEGTTMMGAMYRGWRTSPRERVRTMRLLACEDTSVLSFLYSFWKVGGRAGVGMWRQGGLERGKILRGALGRWLSRGVDLVSGYRAAS